LEGAIGRFRRSLCRDGVDVLAFVWLECAIGRFRGGLRRYSVDVLALNISWDEVKRLGLRFTSNNVLIS
jgi:hypothetical protein